MGCHFMRITTTVKRDPKKTSPKGLVFRIQIRIYKILIQYRGNRDSAKKHGVARFSNGKDKGG
ncbi:hypothetical protein EDM56_01570 [Brevibacillus fluminis]|uniref:Uncharacterized protein n=1 Tax=Brevibacillus fluminis TaxID=511487 RepID=A0A3M8DWV8_9BACL|nr:hypothetical protein EDM56_01570 [Brevibacillus fluminis]